MAQNRTTLYQILENDKGDCLEPVITYVLLLQYYALTFESLSLNTILVVFQAIEILRCTCSHIIKNNQTKFSINKFFQLRIRYLIIA